MKNQFDEMETKQSSTKKKVRRRIKKRPNTTGINYTDRHSAKQPSRFRVQSADWKAGMEETIPYIEQENDKEVKNSPKRRKSFTPMQWASGFMAVVIFFTSMTSTVVYASYKGEQKVNDAYAVLAAYEESSPAITAMATEIAEEEIPLAMDEPVEIKGKTVSLVLSSVEKDLKIKVVDEEDNLLKGIRWKASVTDEDNHSTELVDDDMDGIIYAKDMAAGDYSVALITDLPADEYILPTAPMMVAVKDKIEYKVIQDIKDLIKKESEINVAAEDTGGQQAADVEAAALKDTVEYVESTKSAIGKVPGYVPVEKNTADLSKVTAAMNPSWIKSMRAAAMGVLKAASGSGIFGNQMVGFPTALLSEPADQTVPDGEPTTPASVEVTSVKVSGGGTIAIGATTGLAVDVQPTNHTAGSVEWSSDKPEVATVDESGTVTGVSAGTATITALVGGQSGSAQVTVSAPVPVVTVSKVVISDTSKTLTVSKTTQLTATVSYSDGSSNTDNSKLEWSSSDPAIATVNNGLITAQKAGSATITVKSKEDTTKSAACTVTVGVETPFTISPAAVSIEASATTKLTTSLAATFVSSNTSVATVASDGTVEGIKAGTATITATCSNGSNQTAACTVTVTDTGIVLSGTAEIAVGKTTQLKAALTPTTATVKSWASSDTSVATVSGKGLVTGVKAGTATITAEASTGKKATIKITVNSLDDKTELFDKNGNKLYVRTGSEPNYEYRRATYADYKNASITKFYIYGEVDDYKYTGWQTINGKTYYYKKDNTKVTGEQVIGGVKYNFASDGSLTQGSGTLGIDVSKYQPSINWASVKASGISYVIIRCGYRGSSTGVLVEDPYFRSHIKGAKAAGLKVGVYFFTTAVTEAEAVEEASMCAALCSGYGINYPIFMDCESSGRAGYMAMSPAQRTSVIKAFCNTIKSAGYTPGVYANKTWLTSYMNASELSAYKIWLAQYNSTVTYKGRYDLWQFTSKGTVNGISGRVDMNQSYLGY